MGVTVRVASDYASLCFHGLAHLPLRGPERLYDLGYLEHARGTLPMEAIEPLATDASAIAIALQSRAGATLAAQWLPRLHPSIDSFLAASALELNEIEDADARALASLRAHHCDGLEWLRTDLLLIAQAYAASAPDLTSEASALQEHAADLVDLGLPEHFEVAPSLGPRGRAYPNVIIVGAPQPWWCRDEIDRAIPLVLAIHENAVRSGAGDYVTSEWAALRSVARTLHTSPLADSHQRWLATLDLEELLTALERARVASRLDVDALRAHPHDRAEHLAKLDDR